MNNNQNTFSSSNRTRKLVFAAIIAAIYSALTLSLSFSSFGVVQFRIAEGLTVLPFFSSFAIPGLFIGCILSNIISPMGTPDLIFGSLATLVAAIMTYYIGKSNIKFKEFLAPLPAVVVNAIVIGIMLKVLYVKDMPVYLTMLQVGLGQLVCCYGIGLPLMKFVQKNPTLSKYFR